MFWMAAMLLLIGFQGVLDGCYVIAQELLVFWVISYVLGNCESGCLAVFKLLLRYSQFTCVLSDFEGVLDGCYVVSTCLLNYLVCFLVLGGFEAVLGVF